VIRRAGRQFDSITLTADAQHLLVDVWTTVGVLVGVGGVGLTGWRVLDPAVALVVATQIVVMGVQIVRKSVLGLLDTALPAEELDRIRQVLDTYRVQGMQYHALRSRQAGARRFVSVHVLVPGTWTVDRGHELLERLEADVRRCLANVTILTHLEPLSDPASWEDLNLDRPDPAAVGVGDSRPDRRGL
jgi:cation diffusion facilitator family transporter